MMPPQQATVGTLARCDSSKQDRGASRSIAVEVRPCAPIYARTAWRFVLFENGSEITVMWVSGMPS